jgi:hypothetical protein
MDNKIIMPLIGAAIMLGINGCTPSGKVEAPNEPIQINMNVKIQQEVRIMVERDLEGIFASSPGLFGIPETSETGK